MIHGEGTEEKKKWGLSPTSTTFHLITISYGITKTFYRKTNLSSGNIGLGINKYIGPLFTFEEFLSENNL